MHGFTIAEGDHVAHYREHGFAIVRGLFGGAEIARIGAAADQLHDEALRHGRSFRHGNLFYRLGLEAGGAPVVQMVQWPSYHQPVLDAVRLDRRIAALLEPLVGRDLKQIINQVHWKQPGAKSDFAWHQDSRFRKPEHAYRRLAESYVQTGLAIDPQTRAAGCLRFIPGSHRCGDLALDMSSDVLGREMSDEALEEVGLDAAAAIDVEMAPGDLTLWNPYLVHGSGANHEAHQRRLYINGYVRAADCDRGEWAFRDGEPVPFGPEPALVHYEELRERGGPHYL